VGCSVRNHRAALCTVGSRYASLPMLAILRPCSPVCLVPSTLPAPLSSKPLDGLGLSDVIIALGVKVIVDRKLC
jgi:hypothetical protein